MKEEHALQIAQLINSQNKLTREYDANMVMESEKNYIYYLDQNSRVVGVVEVKSVQWYQSEVLHVSVDPSMKRQGMGVKLLTEAEEKGSQQGARILQCTIRADNKESIGLFNKMQYSHVCSLYNQNSKNNVTIWQKVISPTQ